MARRAPWLSGLAALTAAATLAALGVARAEDDLSRLSAVGGREDRERLTAAVRAGERLAAEEATARRARLTADPKDLEARLSLLGRLSLDAGSEGEFRVGVLGLVEHHARDPVADAAAWLLDLAKSPPEAWKEVGDAWRRLLAETPEDLAVATNGGLFFTSEGRPADEVAEGVALLSRARASPRRDERASRRLVAMGDRVAPAVRYDALSDLRDALPAEERRRTYVDGHVLEDALAQAAFAKGDAAAAKRHAEELLGWATREALGWDHGNVVHDMNALLGRVALAEKDVSTAKERLLAAGATPGSPQLDSFGPDWTLADLLQRAGEREAVLRYLERVAKFWDDEDERIETWRREIEAGRAAEFPVSRERPRKPEVAAKAEPPSTGPAKPIAGYWESTVRSGAGMGHAWELRPDGTARMAMFVGGDALWSVEGGRLTLRPPEDPAEAVTVALGEFDRDSWTSTWEDETKRMTRVTPAVPGASPVVGVWKWKPDDGETPTYYERYSPDGGWSRRLPMPARSGRWSVEGSTLRLDLDERTENRFRIDGDRLKITDPAGTSVDYRWAGESAWYPL